SLKGAASEMEQFAKNRKRPVMSFPRADLPGGLPYRMAGGGRMMEIQLPYTLAGDELLKKLADLPAIERLDLEGTEISDAGLESLTRLQTLKDLDISHTQVTDEGLAHLS